MEVPRMFRAQVQGHCSLQFVPDRENREKWLKEWVDPQETGTPYQHDNLSDIKKAGLYGNLYCIPLKFPYRVFTNSGQDTIFRPTLGKNGIPYLPGSSIKGVFRRVCDKRQQQHYCGTQDHPGILRFHGAYPTGDWTGKHRVRMRRNGQTVSETRYSLLDLVHPQQDRQVKNQEGTSAIALISFYRPHFVFQFSSNDSNINWEEVEALFQKALSLGLGGKTSTGYGFAKSPHYVDSDDTLHITLEGSGVSSVTLTGDSEFRPNTFKACVRGHLTRLFAGVCNNERQINQAVEELLGSTTSEGLVKLFWEEFRDRHDLSGRNPTYTTQGKLHIYAPLSQRELLKQVIQFAYIMAGFGKSWRRVNHEKFYPWYHDNKFAIGCHWLCQDNNFISVKTPAYLTAFLNELQQVCQDYLEINTPQPLEAWRESWHPEQAKVYSKVVEKSQLVQLFHEDNFKTTPAIGGRNSGDKRPRFVSCVWHRMLPLAGEEYLEIVTIFKGNDELWEGKNGIKKGVKQNFINAITEKGFVQTWGAKNRVHSPKKPQ